MLKLPEFKTFVETRLQSAVGPVAPIKFANTPFTPPPNGVYVSLRYMAEQAFSSSMGKRKRYRHTGGLQFDVHAPPEAGTGPAEAMIDPIVAAFQDLQHIFGTSHQVSFREFGRDEFDHDGKHRLQLRVVYQRDVTQ